MNSSRTIRKRIVVSLEPGDVIGMRLERTRTTYRAPLASVFRTLADWHARTEARAKREARKLKSPKSLTP